jgi:triosephosphate isomerase (TIM)
MANRRPLMAGNWKMNLNHLEAIALVQKIAYSLNENELTDVEVAVLPPFTDIRSVQTLIDGDKYKIGYGGQDCSQYLQGAYTGEVSAAMLAKLGCTYVVLGHSERREYHGESDQLVNAKAKTAISQGLTPIVCVGEGLDIRKAGGHVDHSIQSITGSLEDLTSAQVAGLVVAYEPVWAIGTGEVATPEDAQEVCGAIRSHLAAEHSDEVAATLRILYGGSVKSSNVAAIMAQPDVDGALIGGASLDADEFVAICKFPQHPA